MQKNRIVNRRWVRSLTQQLVLAGASLVLVASHGVAADFNTLGSVTTLFARDTGCPVNTVPAFDCTVNCILGSTPETCLASCPCQAALAGTRAGHAPVSVWAEARFETESAVAATLATFTSVGKKMSVFVFELNSKTRLVSNSREHTHVFDYSGNIAPDSTLLNSTIHGGLRLSPAGVLVKVVIGY